jgi:ribA/ribD-fused uncharacterized protein
MREVLLAKFSQHPDIKEILLSTGNKTLVEHTENDRYWGGKRTQIVRALITFLLRSDGGDGSGKNKLGRLLMETREKLRQQQQEQQEQQ